MAGMTPSGSAGDDRSYAMGMHTEQLAGRTQQVFFRPEEGERFLYPWAPEVDYNKRAELDADALTSTEVNSRLRALMNEGYGTIVVRNPRGKHSLGVGILNRLNLIFEGSLGYFAVGLIDGPNVRIHGRVGWSCGENMMAGTVLIEKNAGSTFGAAIRGGDLVCRGSVGSRTGIDMKGGHHHRGRRHRRLLRLHDAARAHGGVRQRGEEPRRFDVRRDDLRRRDDPRPRCRCGTGRAHRPRQGLAHPQAPAIRAAPGSGRRSRLRASITSRRSSPASSSGTTTIWSRPRRS